MNTLKNKSLIPVRLGRLLQAAGIIQPSALTTALACARTRHMKVGEILCECNLVREPVLQAALEAQRLVRESLLSFELAVEALRLVQTHNMGIHHALKRLGWNAENQFDTSDSLSRLLIAVHAANQMQLDQARWMAQKRQITFGEALIQEAGLPPKLLIAALDSLVLIRDGKLNAQQAVDALTRVKREGITIYETLEEPPYPVARIGELLTMSGILSETDVTHVLEVALLEQKRIGEVLMQSALITPVVVDGCLRTQSLISQGRLSLCDGIDLLRSVHEQQRSLESVVREMIAIRLQACGLLHQLNFISDAELFEAGRILENLGDPMLAFALNGRMNGFLLQTAVECSIRIYEKSITLNEALNGLTYCASGQGSLDSYIEQVELAELRTFFGGTQQGAHQVARSA